MCHILKTAIGDVAKVISLSTISIVFHLNGVKKAAPCV